MENNNLSPIHLRNVPPPAETFDHVSFFKFLFSWIKPESYLELGVRDGKNFVAVSQFCKKAVGVDITPFNHADVKSEIFEFHNMSTDKYFEQLDKETKFDVVFIDADHSHEQSLKDFLRVKVPCEWCLTEEKIAKRKKNLKEGFLYDLTNFEIPEGEANTVTCLTLLVQHLTEQRR